MRKSVLPFSFDIINSVSARASVLIAAYFMLTRDVHNGSMHCCIKESSTFEFASTEFLSLSKHSLKRKNKLLLHDVSQKLAL